MIRHVVAFQSHHILHLGTTSTTIGLHRIPVTSLPAVRLVHQRNLARNRRPLELALERLPTLLALVFFPFEEFVSGLRLATLEVRVVLFLRKAKMWLDDDVESSGTDKTAIVVSMQPIVCKRGDILGPWERESQLVHHLCDADCCRP